MRRILTSTLLALTLAACAPSAYQTKPEPQPVPTAPQGQPCDAKELATASGKLITYLEGEFPLSEWNYVVDSQDVFWAHRDAQAPGSDISVRVAQSYAPDGVDYSSKPSEMEGPGLGTDRDMQMSSEGPSGNYRVKIHQAGGLVATLEGRKDTLKLTDGRCQAGLATRVAAIMGGSQVGSLYR